MPNTGLMTREQLTHIDKIVYAPKQAELIGRSLFQSIECSPWDNAYRYSVISGTGQAHEYTNRETDTPTVDASLSDAQVPILQYALAADYSIQEIGISKQVGFDLLNQKAQLVARGMAEFEDRLIFNGHHDSKASLNVDGLTTPVSETGFQEATAPDTFAKLTAADNTTGNVELRNFFQDVVDMITSLPGYANAKPILALPKAEMTMLNRPFNEYNPQQTVLTMIQPWFSRIITVPNFEAKYFGAKSNKKDMGMVFLNDPEVAAIPDAMPLTRLQPEYKDTVTRVTYLERTGGLAVRYPSAFVRLDNIN